jgi:hypothetical protein
LFSNNFHGFVLVIVLAALGACSTTVRQAESTDYKARAEMQTKGKVEVSAVVLSAEESVESFGFALDKRQIQPVWIKVENRGSTPLNLMLPRVDPDYYSPSEVAWTFRNVKDPETGMRRGFNRNIAYFLSKQIPAVIPANSTVAGYVYTRLDPGRKAFSVDFFGNTTDYSFEYVQAVPGFEADFSKVDFQDVYQPGEVRDIVDLAQLRSYLESLPCCVKGGDGETDGDPLNLVFVGHGKLVLATLAQRGWHLTETIRAGTVGRTIVSSVFRSNYLTSPVSPLYLFGRPQDAALQKARGSVDERNHMRVWLAPVTFKGQEVWVGQISRDIGVKLSSVTIVTHKIDPVVDEARLYIALDIALSQALQSFGYVKGVGLSDQKMTKYNFTKDPYYTDGNRVVLFLSGTKVPSGNINNLRWETP